MLRSKSIAPQNDRDFIENILYIWSKFDDPSLKGSRVIAQDTQVIDI